MGELLVCERPVDGFSWSPPGRALQATCGSSWWWRMWSCRARSQSCCQLGRPRVFVYLSGGQLRPTDNAMAARSARTSSSAEVTEKSAC